MHGHRGGPRGASARVAARRGGLQGPAGPLGGVPSRGVARGAAAAITAVATQRTATASPPPTGSVLQDSFRAAPVSRVATQVVARSTVLTRRLRAGGSLRGSALAPSPWGQATAGPRREPLPRVAHQRGAGSVGGGRRALAGRSDGRASGRRGDSAAIGTEGETVFCGGRRRRPGLSALSRWLGLLRGRTRPSRRTRLRERPSVSSVAKGPEEKAVRSPPKRGGSSRAPCPVVPL